MTLIWHWPQITYAVLWFLSVGFKFHKWAQQESIGQFMFTSIPAVTLIPVLLYLGGFWAGATP